MWICVSRNCLSHFLTLPCLDYRWLLEVSFLMHTKLNLNLIHPLGWPKVVHLEGQVLVLQDLIALRLQNMN